jgi:hypothetical protein
VPLGATSEAHEVPARRSRGLGQVSREIQDPALVRSVQAVHCSIISSLTVFVRMRSI